MLTSFQEYIPKPKIHSLNNEKNFNPIPIYSKEVAIGYIGAMIDGEGHVLDANTSNTRYVGITNTDTNLIDAIVECLNLLEIGFIIQSSETPGETKTGRKYYRKYVVRIRGYEDLMKLCQTVPIKSTKKFSTLVTIINKATAIPTKELLELLYINREMSTTQIAEALECSVNKVWNYLKKYEIPIRDAKERKILSLAQGRGYQ